MSQPSPRTSASGASAGATSASATPTSTARALASERLAHVPSLTTWTRLEPQPRDATLARSLQAQVRDPLWMLARQWQVGEFGGDVGGSPVQATFGLESLPLTGFRAGPPGGVMTQLDPALPIEVQAERGPVAFGIGGSVQLGLLFEDLAADASILPQVIDAFRAAFPISAADPSPHLAGAGATQLRTLASGRGLDGQALLISARTAAAGGAPVPALPADAGDPAVAVVLAEFVAVGTSAFSVPDADSWQSSELSYAFGLEAASADSSVILEADAFGGGHLDWYSFRSSAGAAQSVPVDPTFTTFNQFPLHVTFRGMPSDRWWGFEDAQTDFGQLDAEHVDLAKLLVMEFALVYGSDWFFLPLPTTFGALQRVTTLIVTDTFGQRTLIRPAEDYPDSSGRWSMFTISDADGQPGDYLLMAPTLGLTDDADPIEDVLFLRDPMAAMAWAVELKLAGGLDVAIDPYEAYLARLRAQPSAAPPDPDSAAASIAYTLERPPPDNWIPFVPVLTSSGGTLLRRGTMDLPGPDGTVVKLAAHAEVLEPGQPFYLADRVVTPVGVSVQRYLRRTRTPDGSTLLWMARRSGPGRGPGASGLKYDFLRDAAP
jgi:hypothetical protein